MQNDDQDVIDLGTVRLITEQIAAIEWQDFSLAHIRRSGFVKRFSLQTQDGDCQVMILVRLPEGQDDTS